MTKERILIVDDTPMYLNPLASELEKVFDVDVVLSGSCALEKLSNNYSGYIVDINLPDICGERLISEIKETTNNNAFFCAITGTDFEESILKKSNAYFDDFMNKDSSLKEIQNRILRCYYNLQQRKRTPMEYTFKGLCVNFDTVQIRCREKNLNLTLIEFKILSILIRRSSHLDFFPKKDLIKLIWSDSFVEEKVLNTHVSNLNRKLDQYFYRVKCKRNKGYFIEDFQI